MTGRDMNVYPVLAGAAVIAINCARKPGIVFLPQDPHFSAEHGLCRNCRCSIYPADMQRAAISDTRNISRERQSGRCLQPHGRCPSNSRSISIRQRRSRDSERYRIVSVLRMLTLKIC